MFCAIFYWQKKICSLTSPFCAHGCRSWLDSLKSFPHTQSRTLGDFLHIIAIIPTFMWDLIQGEIHHVLTERGPWWDKLYSLIHDWPMDGPKVKDTRGCLFNESPSSLQWAKWQVSREQIGIGRYKGVCDWLPRGPAPSDLSTRSDPHCDVTRAEGPGSWNPVSCTNLNTWHSASMGLSVLHWSTDHQQDIAMLTEPRG